MGQVARLAAEVLALSRERSQSATEELRLRSRFQEIINRLSAEAEKRVGDKQAIEQRWLEDLRQFNGVYDDKTEANLRESKRSRLFINQTRPKSNSMEARIGDMVAPTDELSWGIQPTPVPELSAEAQAVVERALAAKQAAKDNPQDPNAQAAADAAAVEEAKVKAILDEAKKRAAAMEAEIDDQLREGDYNAVSRDVIRDMVRLGTGVMKGPIVGGRVKRGWAQADAEWQLAPKPADKPGYVYVSPWHFFPETSAVTIDESDGVFERHLLNAKELRRLARRPDIDANAVRKLLRTEPRNVTPSYLTALRSITDDTTTTTSDRWHVWEWHGCLSAEDMRDLALAAGKHDLADLEELDDPLVEVYATVWFCDGELLKLGLDPLDSGDPIYSVANLERSDASLFGFGIPYIMRHPQKAHNSAWRLMLDNAGLAGVPQILVHRKYIEPDDGRWTFEAGKVWIVKETAPAGVRPFEVFQIPTNQAELQAIVEMSKQFIDDETGMPQIAQGDQGAQVTKTLGGMSLLMNSANIVFRRIVKNWDDQMTTPNITRMYHWNMQFSPKEHIKGDYEVDARGSSVLLVREIQGQNLMLMASQFTAHPVLGPLTKVAPLYRRTVQAQMLPADEVVKTDDEIAAEQAAAPPQPDPEMAKLENARNLAKDQHEYRMKELEYSRETDLLKLAQTSNVDLENIRANMAKSAAEIGHKERSLAVESAFKAREPTAPQGGGAL